MSDFWRAWVECWPYVALLVVLLLAFMPPTWGVMDNREGPALSILSVVLVGVAMFWPCMAQSDYIPPKNGNDGSFWREVWATAGHGLSKSQDPHVWPYVGVYLAVGVVWAIIHFWLYANRLGQLYIQNRDAWLQANGWSSLEAVPVERRKELVEIRECVQNEMLYHGDFPLRARQQKRFFSANMLFWPLTLAWYILKDALLDAARSLWYALRDWIQAKWNVSMALYIDDTAICQAVTEELKHGRPLPRQPGGAHVYE